MGLFSFLMPKQKTAEQNRAQKSKKPLINGVFFRPSNLTPAINHAELNTLSIPFNFESQNQRLRNQARNLQLNNPLSAGYLNYLPSEIYGKKGFILNIKTKNKALNKQIESEWFNFENECDIWEQFAFEDFEELVLVALSRDGEAFIQLHETTEGLRLEFIDAERIDNSQDNGDNIIQGIEYYKNTLKPAYYYKLSLSGDKCQKIPATQIIHIKKNILARTARGLSVFGSTTLEVLQRQSPKQNSPKRTAVD